MFAPFLFIYIFALYLNLWTIGGRILTKLSIANLANSGFPDGSGVKNLPPIQETHVQSLGWEDPLDKEMETHSRILAWEIPWTEEPGGLQFMRSQRVWHEWTHTWMKYYFPNYSQILFILLNCRVFQIGS